MLFRHEFDEVVVEDNKDQCLVAITWFIEAIKNHPSLTFLDMSHNKLDKIPEQKFKALADAIKASPALRFLKLTETVLPIQQLKAEAAVNISGQELGIMDSGIIATCLDGSTTLTSLDISRTSLTPGALKTLVPVLGSLSALTSIDMSTNRLCGLSHHGNGVPDPRGLIGLVDSLISSKSLLRLNLSNNRLCSRAAHMFGNAIASSPSLTSVNLSKNPLGGYLEASGNEEYTSDADDDDDPFDPSSQMDWVSDPKGLMSLGASCASSNTMTSIKLLKCNLPIAALKSQSVIDLSGRGLGAEDAFVIAECIKVNPSFLTVDISSNPFCTDMTSMHHLAGAIAANPKITTLKIHESCDLPIHDIKTESALDLSDQEISAEAATIIAAW